MIQTRSGGGTAKESCVTYECSNPRSVLGCNNADGNGVGPPTSDLCLDGDYVYCYNDTPQAPPPAPPPPCTSTTTVVLNEGQAKQSCVTYQCPPGLPYAGCNNENGQGVGPPTSDLCLDGDYVYCYA